MSRQKVTKFILVIFLCILLLEISLRIIGSLYLHKLYLQNFSSGNSKNTTIICLGESSTGGLWVDWNDSYPKQLERKLREYYGNEDITVIVPPHMGQNTSQMANRINQYIKLYKPKLIILMAGVNNEWSLAESHILKFLNKTNKDTSRIKALLALDNFRLFKVLRYFYLKFIAKEKSVYMQQNKYYVWGHPEASRYPPSDYIYSFAMKNKPAFLSLWRHDLRNIIQEVKRNDVKVLLMTYHINTAYLSINDFFSMAEEQEIPLVRNDLSFNQLVSNGTINQYILQDNWHPNKQGYSIIANNAFDYIKKNNLLGLNNH